MKQYAFFGKFKTHDGTRDELLSILLQAASLIENTKGCRLYLVSKDMKDANTVCVNEVWDTKEDHDNSLKIEGAADLISKAMPLLNGRPESIELEVIGGKTIS